MFWPCNVLYSWRVLFLKVSPENEGWILSRLWSVHFVGSIVLGDGDLHELRDVEGEGEDGDGHDVNLSIIPFLVSFHIYAIIPTAVECSSSSNWSHGTGEDGRRQYIWNATFKVTPLEHTSSCQVQKLDKTGFSDEGRQEIIQMLNVANYSFVK